MSSDTILIQASAVAIEGITVMIEGAPGSGKSSLALALIDRGADLIGDDGVQLQRAGQSIVAKPPPNIEGKLEIRNIGIVEMPAVSAPLGLILTLTPDAPRFPETLEQRAILGINIPVLAFRAGDAVQALRAEWALKMHGIQLHD